MDAGIVQRLRDEEAVLMRKLDAIRAVLAAYGEGVAAAPVAMAPRRALDLGRESSPIVASGRERVGLDRFSEYGAQVVRMAIKCVKEQPIRPVPTRQLVALIESQGVDVRGVDKVNALSALLARSADLRSIGRRGWTLVDEDRENDGQIPIENEPPSDFAGGSDVG